MPEAQVTEAQMPEAQVTEAQVTEAQVTEAQVPEEAQRKKRKRSVPETYQTQIDGKTVVLYKGTSVVEDPRWIHILQVKENGTKRYRCPACGHEFTGKEGRVIIHKLQKGGEVKPCAQLPSPECRAVLERIDGASRVIGSGQQALSARSGPS